MSAYDVIQHQVAPILRGAKRDCLDIERTGESILKTIQDGVTACGDDSAVAGALKVFGASTAGTLHEALALATAVITAGYKATNAYIEADFQMTGNVHKALQSVIAEPWEHKQ
jgi:hypothetical protein